MVKYLFIQQWYQIYFRYQVTCKAQVLVLLTGLKKLDQCIPTK